MSNPVPLPMAGSCLFLDVDGTLLEFSAKPSQTVASSALKDLLLHVNELLDGALALISGRRLVELDRIFFPLRLPAAGVHGGERRETAGMEPADLSADPRLDGARACIRHFTAGHQGVALEDKLISLAVHFRANPGAQAAIETALAPVLESIGGEFHALEGNMVIEIKPRAFSKENAIREFMSQQPFAGRHPIFVGDDVTDIDGLRFIEACNGTSIAVGDRVQAQWRLADPQAVRDWLTEFAAMSTQ